MAAVGLRDEAPRGIQVVVAPRAKLQFGGQVNVRTHPCTGQLLHHKEPPVNLKAGFPEDVGMRTGRVQEQLRFNAIDMRGVLQGFKDVP